ncbi:DUF2304 domain-containing protein [Candidatus Parcubacteria bacterium]|nr:MAG: DUF2304 domain-containing protein [Candidatus Parcubacteria bacterium]
MIFQVALIIFSIFGLITVFKQYRAKKVSLYWYLLWTLFWLGVAAVAFAPQWTDIIASYVGVEKGADLIAYSAIVILSYTMYRVLVRLEKIKREITELTRRVAIELKKMEDKK